jgi:hypothetical protein
MDLACDHLESPTCFYLSMSQDAWNFPHARFGQQDVTHTALGQHDMAMANFLKPAPTTAIK